jgi:hypothetical protein
LTGNERTRWSASGHVRMDARAYFFPLSRFPALTFFLLSPSATRMIFWPCTEWRAAARTHAPGTYRVKLFGFVLLLAGWGLVVSALALLAADAPRNIFILAGVGVEIVGLVIVIRAHTLRQGAQD